jgi:hypothetical protein
VHQRAQHLLEHKLSQCEDQLSEAKAEYSSLKFEYESYKLKAQTAFKKQKTQSDVNPDEQKHYLDEIDKLKRIVQELQQNLTLSNEKFKLLEKENYLLQDEYALCLERNTKLISELKEKEAECKLQSGRLEQRNLVYTAERDEALKIESQTKQAEEKLRTLSVQSSKSINLLQVELAEFKQEVVRLKRELAETQQLLANQTAQKLIETNLDVKAIKEQVDNRNNFILGPASTTSTFDDLLLQKVNSPPNTTKTTKTLEELLNEPNLFYSSTSNSDDTKLLLNQIEQQKSDLNKSKRQLEHLSELLNESELNNSRLSDQINLLKEEIRRLERNQQREKSISNMEYLKNVVYKFLTFTSIQERAQLLPVLSTMLKLSQEEQNTIMSIKVLPNNSEAAAGWSGYLPKWT